jgi:hypothetical protein
MDTGKVPRSVLTIRYRRYPKYEKALFDNHRQIWLVVYT